MDVETATEKVLRKTIENMVEEINTDRHHIVKKVQKKKTMTMTMMMGMMTIIKYKLPTRIFDNGSTDYKQNCNTVIT